MPAASTSALASIISAAIAAAPIEPQTRALSSDAVLEVPGSAAERADPPQQPTPPPVAGAPEEPPPRIETGEASETTAPPAGFDGSPIYLGCGRSVPACERLTTVGLVTGGGGLALIAGSAALLFTPDRVIADEPAYVRNYSRAGTTLMAIGIGLATTGVLMLLTAARAANKRRRLDASLAARGR